MRSDYFLTNCGTLIKAEVKEPRVGFRTINEDYESAVKKYGKCGVYAMWDKKRQCLETMRSLGFISAKMDTLMDLLLAREMANSQILHTIAWASH